MGEGVKRPLIWYELHGPIIGQNFVECSIFNPSLIGLRKHLVIGQFSLFSFSLLFIVHHQSANLV